MVSELDPAATSAVGTPNAPPDNSQHEAKSWSMWNRKQKVGTSDEPQDVAVVVEKPEHDLKTVSFASLFRFATPVDLLLNAVGILCAAAAGAAQPLMSLLFGKLTQSFVEFAYALNTAPENVGPAAEHFRKTASDTALYLVILGVGMLIVSYTYMMAWTYTGEVQSKRIRENYLRAVLRQDVAFFDKLGAGEVTTRIQTDCHLIQQGISEKVPLCVNYLSAFLTYVSWFLYHHPQFDIESMHCYSGYIVAFVQCWKLSLALLAILPATSILGACMAILPAKIEKRALEESARAGSIAEEVLSTIRTAHAFGTQRALAALYGEVIRRLTKAETAQVPIYAAAIGGFYFIPYSAYALAISFGTTLFLKGEVTAGQIISVIMAIIVGSFSMAMFGPEMESIGSARGAASKVFDLIDRVPPIDSADPSGQKPESVEGRITFEQVAFEYPARPELRVLKGISLAFEAGKTSALVGASGSGKSTIVQLIERFYDPTLGFVKLDNIELRDLNVRWLRSQIGLVSQEAVLFATTIRGNVENGLIGTPWEHADAEKKMQLVREACVKANADGFISKLPNGYDTLVGERGVLLSGGQKQRIAIARAIASDPKILLLDEATSALDTESEGVVQNALDKAAAGRTTIAIAHRLSTIKNADQIFVMGDGEVLEHGTHAELMRNPSGPYAILVEAQRLRESTARIAKAEVRVSADSVDENGGEKLEVSALDRPQNIDRQDKTGISQQDTHKNYSLLYLFRRMGRINKSEWKTYVVGLIAGMANGCTYPMFGIVYGRVINGFALTNRHDLRIAGDRNALWFFLIAVLSTIVATIKVGAFAHTAAVLCGRLRNMMFRALLRQNVEYFDREENNSGVLTSNLSEGAKKIDGLAGTTLGALVSGVFTVIVGSIVGLVYGWKLALVAIVCLPIIVSAGYVRLRVVMMKDQVNKSIHATSTQVACESAGAIRTVASLIREEDCCRVYSNALEAALKTSIRTAVVGTALFSLTQASSFWIIALVFWYGSRLVASLEYSTQSFFVVLISVTFSAIEAGNVFSYVPDMSAAKSAAVDVVKLLDRKPSIDNESTEGTVLQSVAGRVVFNDVHFRYPSRPTVPVLRGLSITIEPGTFVALVGASGCGKSTVVQLTERFYDPESGSITVDGVDIVGLNLQEYRLNMALVAQEPTLYSGTIKFNILLGARKPPHEVKQDEIEQACRDANILDFIHSLPDGFETEVGGKGSQLSGGQKQRIAIARALLRNPKILLLDEATSALDSSSERIVQEALDKAARGRTTIAIAHRLSTIQNADCIYFIKEGQVAEAGTHDQLLARSGAYAEYVQLQALSHAD